MHEGTFGVWKSETSWRSPGPYIPNPNSRQGDQKLPRQGVGRMRTSIVLTLLSSCCLCSSYCSTSDCLSRAKLAIKACRSSSHCARSTEPWTDVIDVATASSPRRRTSANDLRRRRTRRESTVCDALSSTRWRDLVQRGDYCLGFVHLFISSAALCKSSFSACKLALSPASSSASFSRLAFSPLRPSISATALSSRLFKMRDS